MEKVPLLSKPWDYVQESYSGSRSRITSEELNTESEVLQKVTDYSTEGLSEKVLLSMLHITTG